MALDHSRDAAAAATKACLRTRGAAAPRYRARLHSCGRRLGPMLVDHLQVQQDLADRQLADLLRRPAELVREHEARARQRRLDASDMPRSATLSPLTRFNSSSRKRASPAGSAWTCSKVNAGSTRASLNSRTESSRSSSLAAFVDALHVAHGERAQLDLRAVGRSRQVLRGNATS